MQTKLETMNHHKFHKIGILFLLLGSLLAACAGVASKSSSSGGTIVKTEKGQYTNLTVVELQAMLKHKDFTFVNVHTPYAGHIAQTDAFIPYDQIAQNLDKLPADKSAKIVLYCHGGNMSTTAARALANLGYSNVYQLVGGFASWKEAGLSLETQKP